jgi:hypothetical protein
LRSRSEAGTFRRYLLGVKHFLPDESDRASGEKRGGDARELGEKCDDDSRAGCRAKRKSRSTANGRHVIARPQSFCGNA